MLHIPKHIYEQLVENVYKVSSDKHSFKMHYLKLVLITAVKCQLIIVIRLSKGVPSLCGDRKEPIRSLQEGVFWMEVISMVNVIRSSKSTHSKLVKFNCIY